MSQALKTRRIMAVDISRRPAPSPAMAHGVRASAVGAFVPRLAKAAFDRFGGSAARLVIDWPKVAGADVAQYAAVERLHWPKAAAVPPEDQEQPARAAATLTLRVEPARALDVQYRRQQILERINGYFGYRAVGEIRIVQAPLRPDATTPPAGRALARPLQTPARQPVAVQGPSAPPPVPVGAIADPRLRTALERLVASVAAEPASRA